MARIAICDLCGKPIDTDEPRIFKIKELKVSWHERYWEEIDAHNDCILKLLRNVHPENQQNERRETYGSN